MSICIEWNGCRTKNGYGKESFNGGWKLAHRSEWERRNGPIPLGICVLHKCDNPACINIEHLFLGTKGDNNNDRHAKGRSGKHYGVLNGGKKITEQTAIRIKMLSGIITAAEIGRWLGISGVQAANIMTGRSWKHITANTRYKF